MAGLADLQAWLQATMLDGAAEDARAHVLGDNRLTAEMRLGIYARGYRMRLRECLEAEYPVLAALAGPTAFGLFAQGYIAARPSRSYTLYDFGAGFPDYLETVRPRGDGTAETFEAIPAALARIERARAEVHRARGVERESAGAAEIGFDPLIAAILAVAGCRPYARPDSLRLLALPFDFTATLAAAEQREPPPLPVVAPSFMAVGRANYHVECHRLEAWQFDWLSALPDAAGAGAVPPRPAPDQRLSAWLPFAIGKGLAVPIG